MSDEYIKRSQVTGKKYDYFSKDVIRLLNPYQCAYYLDQNVELIDIYTSKDRNTGKPVLVYVFDRASSREAFSKWCEREHKGV